ncbi:hypothetical protein TCAL_04310 [Tigriopus californicus]|uniref:Uncharacterized protein n=1 Tax=Tigriopus californicus TaxID=6832 RepID=A0A553NB68_TIGCA|nr:hypothetical protein TCAL_04310 [Tigriopus californicus]|eukprot:TCALIF_04310-PA protein Name:"Protein of unknown function" AED:0.31 eAED:0.32 QI:0/-1/0/1/-1/1/1/0/356
MATHKRTRWLDRSPWCCGSLQIGAIAVALTNLVSLVLGFLWTIQFLYQLRHFFIALVVATLLAFGLLIANVCLMYGSHQRIKAMVWPWILAYSLSAIGLSLALILAFEHLGPFQIVAIPALLFLLYCIWVIVAFFRELHREDASKDPAIDTKVETELQVNVSRMEEGENAPDPSNDDTFTQLPSRTPIKVCNNPFLPDLEDGVARANPTFKATFLPQPDEVIPIQPRFEHEPLLTQPCSDLPEKPPLSGTISTSIVHQRQRSYLTTSEDSPDSAVSSRSKSHSHSALVDIDPSFTPFKRKDGSEHMPKMKIFLPKHGDSSSEDDGEDSASSSSNGSCLNAVVNPSPCEPVKSSNEG